MPTTVSAVLVLVLFVIPGFITNRVLSSVFAASEPAETRTVLTGITYSCLNYAFLSPLLVLTWNRLWYENPSLLAAIAFLVLFVSPVLIALAIVKISDTRWAQKFRRTFGITHPVPKAWDYFFRRGIPCWVLATLKDGRVVAGLYGPNSFASSFPSAEDLYLERLCKLTPEGKMGGLADFSIGAIIKMENVAMLELFEIANDSLQLGGST